MSEDRRFPATPRRRREARQRGQVFRSAEVSGALILLGGVAALTAFGGYAAGQVIDLFRTALSDWVRTPLNTQSALALGAGATRALVVATLPLMGVLAVVGLLANVAQVGFVWSTEPLKPRLNRINPVAGARRLFSRRSVFELIKGLVKLAVVAAVTYGAFRHAVGIVLARAGEEVPALVAAIARQSMGLAVRAGLALAGLAILDYLYQRYEYERSLMMSHQEVKDEHREAEGDPQLRSRIRRRQRELAQARMLQQVRHADVVIVNPTHYAVALRYDPATMAAPICCAKGKDRLALRIRELAHAYDVTWVEDRFLARALYVAVDVGEPVPESLYGAVAEVLAFVWRLRGRSLQDLDSGPTRSSRGGEGW